VYVGDMKDTGHYTTQQPPTAPTMRFPLDQPLQKPEEKEVWEDVNDVGFESLWGDMNDDENTTNNNSSYLTTYTQAEDYQEYEEEEESYHTYLVAPEEKGREEEWPDELGDGGHKSLLNVCRPTTVQQQPLLDLPQHQTLPVVNQLYTLIASLSVCFVVFTYLVYDLM